jgi:hypothetical protein
MGGAVGSVQTGQVAFEQTQLQGSTAAGKVEGLAQMPGGSPASGPSTAEAAQTTQALQTSSTPEAVAQAKARASIPTSIASQISTLETVRDLTPQAAQEGLSHLYTTHQDASVRKALDQAAPAILGSALIPAASVDALVREFKLSGQGHEVLQGMLAEQIAHLVNASSTTETGAALAELRGTEEILKGSGLLDEAGQQLFGDLRAAGDNKQQKIGALQARAEAEAAQQKTGVVSDKLDAIPEPKGSVLARSLGMSALHSAEEKQEANLAGAQTQLAGTQKRLDRIASSKATKATLQSIIVGLKTGDAASLEKCLQFSAAQKTSLEQDVDALQAKPDTPAKFRAAVETLERQAGKLLTDTDATAIQGKIDSLKQHANEGFRAAVIDRHAGVAGTVLADVLAPAGFNERLETVLAEKLSSTDLGVLDKALSPAATGGEKAAGRAVLDRALGDDPTVSDVLLAIKLNRLTPDGKNAAVTRAHECTEAFAEVAALMTQADKSHPMSAQDITPEKLDAWLSELAEGGGEGAVRKMGDADLLLIAARFAAYVEGHTDAGGKNPATVAEFVALLPQGYRENPDLESILGKGLVSSAQAGTAMARVESASHGMDSSRMRSVLAASDPGADAKRATAASNAFARLLARMNLSDLDAPGQEPRAARGMRAEVIQKAVAQKYPGLTQKGVSSAATEAADFTQQASRTSALETALMNAQGVTKPQEITGETLAVSLHAVQRLLAKDLSDLSAGQLKRLGLDAGNCKDVKTLEGLIGSIDWQSQSMDFEHSLLLATYLQATGVDVTTPDGGQALVRQMNELGIPVDNQKGVVELLTLSDEDRRTELGHLKLLNSDHFKMDAMKSRLVFKNDDAANALQAAIKNFKEEGKGARETILSLLKNDVPGVGDRMEVADLILQNKEHASASNTVGIERAAGKKAGLLEGSAVWHSIERDKVGLLNQGSKVAVANRQAQKDLARELLAFSADTEFSGSAGNALSVSMLTQTAVLDAYAAWAEGQSGDTSLKAFEASYRTELAEKNGSALETTLFKGVSANLQTFGLTKSAADAFALSYLFIGKAAGGKEGGGLARLMDGAMKVANGLDFVHQHLTARSDVPEAIARMQEVERQEQASLAILADMKQGESLELTDQKSIKLKGSVPVSGVKVAVQLSAGSENNLKIFRDEEGRASLLIGKQYEVGIGAAASVCNEILKVGVQVEGQISTGVALAFDSDEACARFVAKLVNGQATRTDLTACASIETLQGGGVGVGVGVEVDVGKAIGASVVTLGVEASAGAVFAHETVVGLEGKTVTSRSTVAVQVGARVGIDKGEAIDKLKAGITGSKGEKPEKPEKTEIMESPQAIILDATTHATAKVDKTGLSASVSAGLMETVENKVLTNHAGTHVKQATSSYSTQVASEAAMAFFLHEHGVAASVQKDVAAYMKSHALENVSVTCEYALPGASIQGRTLEEAMTAVNDASRYQLEKLTLSFEDGDQHKSGLDVGGVTIQARAAQQKTVEFSVAVRP